MPDNELESCPCVSDGYFVCIDLELYFMMKISQEDAMLIIKPVSIKGVWCTKADYNKA